MREGSSTPSGAGGHSTATRIAYLALVEERAAGLNPAAAASACRPTGTWLRAVEIRAPRTAFTTTCSLTSCRVHAVLLSRERWRGSGSPPGHRSTAWGSPSMGEVVANAVPRVGGRFGGAPFSLRCMSDRSPIGPSYGSAPRAPVPSKAEAAW